MKFIDFSLCLGRGCFRANGEVGKPASYSPSFDGGGVGYVGKGDVEIEDILGIRNENPPDKAGQCTSLPPVWLFQISHYVTY